MKVDNKKNLQTWFSQTRIVEKGNKFESLECQKINKVKFD